MELFKVYFQNQSFFYKDWTAFEGNVMTNKPNDYRVCWALKR
jgi:hypothetical protein